MEDVERMWQVISVVFITQTPTPAVHAGCYNYCMHPISLSDILPEVIQEVHNETKGEHRDILLVSIGS